MSFGEEMQKLRELQEEIDERRLPVEDMLNVWKHFPRGPYGERSFRFPHGFELAAEIEELGPEEYAKKRSWFFLTADDVLTDFECGESRDFRPDVRDFIIEQLNRVKSVLEPSRGYDDRPDWDITSPFGPA